jgi:hypothetical protein
MPPDPVERQALPDRLKRPCVLERVPRRQWHIAGDGDDMFRKIACAGEEGVNMPGPIENREPTCKFCRAIARKS